MSNRPQMRFDPVSGQLVDMQSGARCAPPATLNEITGRQRQIDDATTPAERRWRDDATGTEYLEHLSDTVQQPQGAVRPTPQSPELKATITSYGAGIDFLLPPLPQGASFYDVLFIIEGGAWVAIYDHAKAGESYKHVYDRSREAQLQIVAVASNGALVLAGVTQIIPAYTK